MKKNEAELRQTIADGAPFTIVLTSGDRVRVPSHDHIFLPPLEDEDGVIEDQDRENFFQVWSKGQHYRWVAFDAIAMLDRLKPQTNGQQTAG